MTSDVKFIVVTKAAAVSNLELWQMKGHSCSGLQSKMAMLAINAVSGSD